MSHYQNQQKKGLTEKIKEKIPGLGRKQDNPYQQGHNQQGHTTSTTAPGYYEGQHHQGLTEKIKEQIPGVGHQQGHTTSATNPYQQSHTTSATVPGHYKGQQHQEKKGVMEKIKEKLPGHR
ncbi:hypothetical protein RGQ29_004509 [Quercus rubra]|uniref:Dehydrin n=1 Tax=Quercus rubra TaxID=3512 RepID=A0AAN7IGH5_QUERU|nr:hypothetical protein RGQ29_004509 [Quercus rubra]